MPAKPDPVVHAFVRAHVTLRLIAELPPEIILDAFSKRATVQLLTPGGPKCSIRVNRGEATFSPARRLLPTVSLWFSRPKHMATLLSGGKAPVFPIPSSLRFLSGVRAFQSLTAAVQQAFKDPSHRVRLLLLGILFALEEVAVHDAYVTARVARIKAGTISISVEDHPEIRGWFRKGRESTTPGGKIIAEISSGAGAPDTEPNAELVFADVGAAEALLTGKLPSMLALAERRVRIYGRLPMIQNLFPILDRVAIYMGSQS